MNALLIKTDPKRPNGRVIYSGSTKVGTVWETDRPNPDMRFKWTSENDHYGYAGTLAAALVELTEKVPGVIAEADKAARAAAEFDALPVHVQDLVLAEQRARIERDRERNRTILHEERLAAAEAAWETAKAALDAALSPVAEAA
jgi:hypothetical protein